MTVTTDDLDPELTDDDLAETGDAGDIDTAAVTSEAWELLDFDVVDLFAGPGGWDEGSRALAEFADAPDRILGIEWDGPACDTARAAGHHRLQGDIALLNPHTVTGDRRIIGLIASPPCQGFSLAGSGAGRRDTELILAAAHQIGMHPNRSPEGFLRDCAAILAELRQVVEDDKSALALEPLRWALALRPEWLAWEQVPAVLPLWKECAVALRAHGYHCWVGVLNSADYGVPQTRKRAILIASRTRFVSRPEPTHAKGGDGGDLFSDPRPPWVSMATALGWGMTARPSTTVMTGTGGKKNGGPEPLNGGSGTRETYARARADGEWESRPELVGFPRRSDADEPGEDDDRVVTIDGVDYRARDLRSTDEPAQTVTEKIRSWQRFGPERIGACIGCPPCPGASHEAVSHCAECCFGTLVEADPDCPVHGTAAYGAPVPPGVDPTDPEIVLAADRTSQSQGNGSARALDEPAPTVAFGHNAAAWKWRRREDGSQEPEDPAAVEYVNGTGENAARRPATEPAPTVHFGERLNTVEWQPGFMAVGGVAGDGVPRPVDQPAPTLGGKGTAAWIESEEQWIRADRLASGETPKGARLAGERPELTEAQQQTVDQPAPTIVGTRRSKDGMIVGRRLPEGQSEAVGGWDDRQPLAEGDARVELRRGGDRIEEGFDPAAEPSATVTSRVDRWQVKPTTPGDEIGPDRPAAADPDDATVDLWGDRPATTVVASRNPDIVSGPGYRGPGAAPRQEAPGGVRVTVQEAALLQSFPADYPWQGNRTKQYQQVGNAVPCRLAAHVLAEAIGCAPPVYEAAS